MRLAQLLVLVFTTTFTLLSVAPLRADFLIIDSWETPQSITLDGVVVGAQAGTLAGVGIFGDGRGYSINTLNTAISLNAQNAPTRQLQLQVNPYSTPSEANFRLSYIDSASVKSLTDLGAFGIELNNIATNSAWTVRIELKDTANTTSFYQTTLAANTNTTLRIPFSAFSIPPSTLGVFREVVVQFINDSGANSQLRVGQLSFQVVPEPSALALGMLSLAGLIVRRRRSLPSAQASGQ